MNMQNVLAIPDPANTYENRILTLIGRLRATIWTLDAESEALGTALCALVLRLNPFITSRMIADALPYGDEKFDLVGFVNVMSNIGYRYSRFTTKLSKVDPRLTPALILRGGDRNSECPQAPSVAWMQDDGFGREQIVELSCDDFILAPASQVDETVTVLVFSRIEEAKLATSSTRREMAGHGWFRALMKRFRGQVRQIMVLGLLLNLISLLVPVLILLIYDRVIGPKTAEPLVYLAIGGIIVACSEFLLRRARSHMLAWFSSRIDYLVGGAIFEHLLRLPPALVQKASVSDQIARLKTFEAVRDFFCGPVLIMSLELPATAASALILWLIAGPMVAVPIIAALALSCIFWSTWRQVRIRIREAAIESSIMQQFSIDTFEKLESIRLDGLSAQWSQKFRDISARELLAQHKLNQVGIRGELIAQFVMGLTVLVGLAYGAQLIWEGEMGTGVLIAGMMLVWRILAPFHSLCGLVPRFEQTRNAIIQIDKLMETGVESQAGVSTIATNRLNGSVSFSNVALRYPGSSSLIFNGLNFEARPGEVLCVTGPNGVGKSSLLKLVLGLESPQIGSVKIDGFDIRQFDPCELREHIAFVPEVVDIISGTVAENLRLALPLADDDRLRSALVTAGAWDEVSQMPDGMETHIAPKQEGVQQTMLYQRIGLARAMLKDAKILLVDEQPSSLILNGLDENLKNCIRSSSSNRTTIFVSYRTDMLRHADRVIALRPGMKPVIGSPDKIMDLN